MALRSRPLPLVALGVLATLAGPGCRRAPPPAPTTPLRVVTYSAPLSLDPHLHNEVLTLSVLGNLYETLVAFDAELRVQPALALSWENPNDLTWRFRLRPGVHFHDGRQLTAEDVVASLERIRGHPRSALGNYLVSVESIRRLDAASVEIVTSRPSPVLLNKLCTLMIVPRDAPDEIHRPIGSGPYRLAGTAAGGGLRLAAFAGHWRGPPPEPWVEIAVEPDARARLALLLGGRADLVTEVAPEAVPDVNGCPRCRLAATDGPVVEYLQMRVDRPPFADLRVRQAVSLAVDRDALVHEQLRGEGTPIGQLVGRQVFGYAPDLAPPPRDLARARRLLAEAGYPSGFDVELELRESRRGDLVARQLAAAGIRVTLVPRPWEEMFRRLQSSEVPFYLGGLVAISADASAVFDSKVHSRDPLRGYGDTNYNRYASVELDALIESSATSMDMLARRQLLQAAMRRTMADLPLVPLFVPHEIYGVSDDLLWEPRRDGMLRLYEMRRAARGE